MTVKTDKLVRMAEQIRANLAFTEDESVVADKVADHLRRFWDPRMQAAIQDYHAQHPDALSPALARAVETLD